MPGTTDATLNLIKSLGYAVSEFRLPSSLNDIIPPAVEIHAVALNVDPPQQYVARVEGEGNDVAYQCACLLAGLVGIIVRDE